MGLRERDRHRLKRRDKEKGRQKAEEWRKEGNGRDICTHIWCRTLICSGAGEGDEFMATLVHHKAADWKEEGERETDRWDKRWESELMALTDIHLLWQRSCLISRHALWPHLNPPHPSHKLHRNTTLHEALLQPFNKKWYLHTMSACLLQLLLHNSWLLNWFPICEHSTVETKETCVCVCYGHLNACTTHHHIFYFCCSAHWLQLFFFWNKIHGN